MPPWTLFRHAPVAGQRGQVPLEGRRLLADRRCRLRSRRAHRDGDDPGDGDRNRRQRAGGDEPPTRAGGCFTSLPLLEAPRPRRGTKRRPAGAEASACSRSRLPSRRVTSSELRLRPFREAASASSARSSSGIRRRKRYDLPANPRDSCKSPSDIKCSRSVYHHLHCSLPQSAHDGPRCSHRAAAAVPGGKPGRDDPEASLRIEVTHPLLVAGTAFQRAEVVRVRRPGRSAAGRPRPDDRGGPFPARFARLTGDPCTLRRVRRSGPRQPRSAAPAAGRVRRPGPAARSRRRRVRLRHRAVVERAVERLLVDARARARPRAASARRRLPP